MAEEGEPKEKYKKFKLTTDNDELDGGTCSPIKSKSLDIFYLLKYLATFYYPCYYFSFYSIQILISYSAPKGVLDLPMEIIEYLTAYLTSEDLLNLSTIGPEILKRCSFNALRKKVSGKRFMVHELIYLV